MKGKGITIEHIQNHVSMCYQFYNEYNWLINSYVLDFFTDNHWSKLPKPWKAFFVDMKPENLANILDLDSQSIMLKIPPLSLLALQMLLKEFSLPRKNLNLNNQEISAVDVSIDRKGLLYEDLHKETKVMKLFWKHVKPKKQHEINIMAKKTFQQALKCDCQYVVDIGSGLGHLSRMMSYGYGLKVCGVEVQGNLSTQAKILDSKFEVTAAKYYDNFHKFKSAPVHLNLEIKPTTDCHEFVKLVKEAFNVTANNFKFGFVGLHPCGDLGATLLRLFNSCDGCSFINIVGCCYMKLSTETDSPLYGYPLSNYCRTKNYSLAYNSREIACHAIEMYIERLNTGYHWELKIHAYRAIIEKLIVKNWPHLKHAPLANVKYVEGLTFSDYCSKALKKLGIVIDNKDIESKEICDYLNDWLKVVIFYTLRLKLAPLVESIILLDRLLFIKEEGGTCSISSAFDPKISPRNYIITGTHSN